MGFKYSLRSYLYFTGESQLPAHCSRFQKTLVDYLQRLDVA